MDNELSDDEVAERARETARRMLATPPSGSTRKASPGPQAPNGDKPNQVKRYRRRGVDPGGERNEEPER